MADTPVTITVDDVSFESPIYVRSEPPSDAPPGDGQSLEKWGMFGVVVPSDKLDLLGAHKDFGRTITMSDDRSSVDVVMLMKVVGNGGWNAYVCVEPEAYHHWNGMEDYPQPE